MGVSSASEVFCFQPNDWHAMILSKNAHSFSPARYTHWKGWGKSPTLRAKTAAGLEANFSFRLIKDLRSAE
jgi:hypothetical protein